MQAQTKLLRGSPRSACEKDRTRSKLEIVPAIQNELNEAAGD